MRRFVLQNETFRFADYTWMDGFYTIKIGEFTKKLIKTTD